MVHLTLIRKCSWKNGWSCYFKTLLTFYGKITCLLHLVSNVGFWTDRDESSKVRIGNRVESFMVVFVVETSTHGRALF